MKTAVIYATDFASVELWNAFLDMIGVERETVVNGKIVPLDFEQVTVATKVLEVE